MDQGRTYPSSVDNSYCTDNVLDSSVDTYSCGETTLRDVDPCVTDHTKPGGATSGHKQEDVDPTIGQNLTTDPTETLECVDVDESDSCFFRGDKPRHHVALPALN